MMAAIRLLAGLVMIACGLFVSSGAQAAESYDNCTDFVDSVPATITTQGVWCLRKDLSTAIITGAAITIAAHNVTLDCNDFKLGGLAAGNESQAYGVYANDRLNATVRNCNVRGFYNGIYLNHGAGHLVENNRLDNNLVTAVSLVSASNSIIRNNRVHDTGGYVDNSARFGIYAYSGDAVEITDNTVAGVIGTAGYYNDVTGIQRGNYIQASGASFASSHITGNRVSGLIPTGAGKVASGIKSANYGNTSAMALIADNHVVMTVPVAGSTGISCVYSGVSMRNNNARGFPTAFGASCMDDGGNVSH
jgi:parallel beta-helix repeat protein